jgi:hypothetical protein
MTLPAGLPSPKAEAVRSQRVDGDKYDIGFGSRHVTAGDLVPGWSC